MSNQWQKPSDNRVAYVLNVNALLQSLVSVPNDFEKFAELVFYLLPKTLGVDFLTHTYKLFSIKSFERQRHGSGRTKTKTPSDWKSFISNDENKQQLIKLLLRVNGKRTNMPRDFMRGRYFSFVQRSAIGYQVKIQKPCQLHHLVLCSHRKTRPIRELSSTVNISEHTSKDTEIIVRSPNTYVLSSLTKFS